MLEKMYLYIQNLIFAYTFRKCEIDCGAPTIARNLLFIRLLSFRVVFSYPVVFFYIFLNRNRNFFIVDKINMNKLIN